MHSCDALLAENELIVFFYALDLVDFPAIIGGRKVLQRRICLLIGYEIFIQIERLDVASVAECYEAFASAEDIIDYPWQLFGFSDALLMIIIN